ncbi:uncharacterized protein BYT42DRAFT_153368 [Radiomyces spectabilis]|uniref:uncharacterized protein n=1 Tax=Radiomyces spectabilis TaxID=64574 RepID=UPI002220AF5A|nr:uncharacterized protein BYT42DRAFT_153368 [Radiomyces spectabilis]KAI8366085.1 hypothetical protein BYT42DRAFT_153368 [Radiomyces spectabilis]
MSTETLVSELNQALDTLTRLHREIGTPYNQINDDKVALFQAISQLTNQHVHDLTTQRDTLRQQRDQALHQMAKLKRLMGDFVPHPSPPVTDHKSLNDQLADLKAQEVELKKGYDEKLNKVKTLHDKLRNYAIPLGGFIDSELLKEEKDIDVSLPKLTALEAQVKRCDEEFVSRSTHRQKRYAHALFEYSIIVCVTYNQRSKKWCSYGHCLM